MVTGLSCGLCVGFCDFYREAALLWGVFTTEGVIGQELE
jgi:hypothetical protein